MTNTTCTAVSPALEGGTCTRDPCTGWHSWQGPAPEILPTAETVRKASLMSQEAPSDQDGDDGTEDPLALPAPVNVPDDGLVAPGEREDGMYQDKRGRWHNANGGFAPAPA